MKQHKAKPRQQNSTQWNQNAFSMNAITLTVLRLIKESLNCDGTWQEKDKKC